MGAESSIAAKDVGAAGVRAAVGWVQPSISPVSLKAGRSGKGTSQFSALSQPGLGNGAATWRWGAPVFGVQGLMMWHRG